MSYLDLQARTGRSTRMMHHAFELAKQGRAVYVAVTSTERAHELEKYRRENAPWSTGIKVLDSSELDIDWERLTLRGAHRNCVLLVDHAVIQRKYSRVLRMLQQYDLGVDEHMSWDRGGEQQVVRPWPRF